MLGAATTTASTPPPGAPTPIISGTAAPAATSVPQSSTQQVSGVHAVPVIEVAPLSIVSVATLTVALYWILVYQNPDRYGSSREKARPALLGAFIVAALLCAATIYLAYFA